MSKIPRNMDFVAVEICNTGEGTMYVCIVDIVNPRTGLISFYLAKDFTEMSSEKYYEAVEKKNIDYVAVYTDEAEIKYQLDPDTVWMVSPGSWKSHYFSNKTDYQDRWDKVFEMVKICKNQKASDKPPTIKSLFDKKLEKAFPRTGGAVLISSGDELDKLIKEAYTLGLKGTEEIITNETNSD